MYLCGVGWYLAGIIMAIRLGDLTRIPMNKNQIFHLPFVYFFVLLWSFRGASVKENFVCMFFFLKRVLRNIAQLQLKFIYSVFIKSFVEQQVYLFKCVPDCLYLVYVLN